MLARATLPAYLSLSAFAMAAAQDVGGSLEGRVAGGGAPLAGASVTVTCPHLPGPRVTHTSVQGGFLFRSLPPGVCEAVVDADGFRLTRITNITIALGQTTSIREISLDPRSVVLDAVVVFAKRGIDPASASLTASVQADDVRRLPTGRSFHSVLPLMPQMETSYLPGDEVNAAGATGPETVYYIDGVNVTEVSLGSGGIYMPLSFIDEVQVTSGGFDASVAGGTGGVVNLVTRTGGSRLTGVVFGYFTNDRLSGAPRFSTSSASERGYGLADFGGALSGPILRDRLSFFLGYDPTFLRRRVGLAGLPPVTDGRSTHSLAGKLTWRASRRAEGSLSVFGDPGSRQSVDPFFPVDSIRNIDAVLSNGRVGGVVVSGQMRWHVASNGELSAAVSYQQRADDARPTTVQGRAEALFFDVPANTLSGGVGLETHLRTARASGAVAATLTVGPHSVRTGLEYERSLYDYTLTYGLGPDGYQGVVVRLDDTTYLWVRGYDAGRVGNRVTSLFVQDAWEISDRLSVSGGIRWSEQRLIASTGRVMQRFAAEWQPRAGLVYRLGRSGTQRVTVSAGRLYETFPANLARFYQQSRRQLITGYDHDPRIDSTVSDTIYALLSSSPPPAQDLKGQSLDEFAGGYDRLIGDKWTVGIRLHHRRLRWVVEDTFDPATGEILIGNPGRGRLSFLPRARHVYTAVVVSASGSAGRHLSLRGSYVLSRAHGNYEGLYDYANLESFPNTSSQLDTPEQVLNSTGLLPNDRTHALKVQATVAWGAGLTMGVVASLRSGTPRNVLGASSFGAPSYIFLRPRGSAGRTPHLADLDVRASWTVPGTRSPALRFTLDLYHIGNSRSAVRYDDALYLAQDGSGNQTVPNPNYGRGLAFQPPFSARLGFVAEF